MKNIHISIHKALTSLDGKPPLLLIKKRLFQSTRLSRASTGWRSVCASYKVISIHKALTSLDVAPGTLTVWVYDFNPQGSHEPRL